VTRALLAALALSACACAAGPKGHGTDCYDACLLQPGAMGRVCLATCRAQPKEISP
jgi:hypothetical protein